MTGEFWLWFFACIGVAVLAIAAIYLLLIIFFMLFPNLQESPNASDSPEIPQKVIDDLSRLESQSIALFQQGDYDGCIEACAAIKRLCQNYKIDFSLIRNIFLQWGNAHMNKGDYNAAIIAWTEVQGDLLPLAISNRAYAHFFEKRYEEALADCVEVLRANPDMVNVYYIKGAARWCMGQKNEAILDLKQAISLDEQNGGSLGGDTHGYFIRGLVMGWLGRPHDAMKDFDYCISLCTAAKDENLKAHAVRLFQKLREKQKNRHR